MKCLFIVLSVCCCVLGCTSSPELSAYVSADKMTFEAISPEYLELVKTSTLDDEQKERRQRLIDSWKMRIENAEKSAAEGK